MAKRGKLTKIYLYNNSYMDVNVYIVIQKIVMEKKVQHLAATFLFFLFCYIIANYVNINVTHIPN